MLKTPLWVFCLRNLGNDVGYYTGPLSETVFYCPFSLNVKKSLLSSFLEKN